MVNMNSNIILIGMPASGKSTLGVLLAKRLAKSFLDTDLVIQERAEMSLEALQESKGMAAFSTFECKILQSLDCRNTVISTGGSAVYSEAGMEHLQDIGRVLFLDVPLSIIKTRIGDLCERGVVMQGSASLDELFIERRKLYLKYASTVIDCADHLPHQLLAEISILC